MSRDTTFSRLPSWAQGALRTAVGSQSVLRGIARAQRDGAALLLQILYRDSRALATVVQHPVQDVQDAYDKAAQDMPPGDVVCYFILATEPSLRRAEAAGVPYMRAYHGVHVSGAILRLPVSLWTESADA